MTSDALANYRRRRNFSRTAEPRGAHPDRTEESRFVVQIHDASTMHFDFRLEVDGVLKSWAVPKGPSADPHDKHLAMPTEDHPLDYRDFEGVIAEGQYGAGTVLIWDEGSYRSLAKDRSGHEIPFADALDRDGHASFVLNGSKLQGAYALTRIRKGADGDREAWLLVKHGDSGTSGHGAPDPARARSVRTGRTLKQVAAAGIGEGP